MNKLLYWMWCGCHTKEGFFDFCEEKGFQWLDILEVFVSWQLKIQEHFSFPCQSLQLLSCFPVQEEQFLFPLLFIFLPFICSCLFIFLLILGCCGTEYAVRGQPALWNK